MAAAPSRAPPVTAVFFAAEFFREPFLIAVLF